MTLEEQMAAFEKRISESWENIAANAARAGVRVALAMNDGRDEFECKKTVTLVKDHVVNTVTVGIMNAAVDEWKRLRG